MRAAIAPGNSKRRRVSVNVVERHRSPHKLQQIVRDPDDTVTDTWTDVTPYELLDLDEDQPT